jgi:phosphosulfolactate phosphohydrolase-like enzyme
VTSKRRTVIIDAFPDSAFRHRERDAVACIDVMLATTTLVTAALQGRRAFVAATLDELRALTTRLPHALVAGGLDGALPGEFDIPDGPCALLRMERDRRPLVLASGPGTELLANAAGGGVVLVASFANLSATAAALARYDRVALLAAGCREEFSCEDQMAAAWIAERLLFEGFEAQDRRTAEIVRRWSGIPTSLASWGNSAAQLRHEARGEEVDFVITHADDVKSPFVFEGGEVCMEASLLEAGAGPGGDRTR